MTERLDSFRAAQARLARMTEDSRNGTRTPCGGEFREEFSDAHVPSPGGHAGGGIRVEVLAQSAASTLADRIAYTGAGWAMIANGQPLPASVVIAAVRATLSDDIEGDRRDHLAVVITSSATFRECMRGARPSYARNGNARASENSYRNSPPLPATTAATPEGVAEPRKR